MNTLPPFIPNEYWYEQLRTITNAMVIRQAAVNPTTNDLSVGQSQLWKNTATGQLRLWANDNGTMKSTLLS